MRAGARETCLRARPGAPLFLRAVSVDAGQGWGLGDAYLRKTFAEPSWTGTRVDEIEVAAVTPMRGLLMRTVRTDAPPRT